MKNVVSNLTMLGVTRQIDARFKERYKNDSNVISVFVVGAMSDHRYEVARNNDYYINVLVKKVTPDLADEFENMVKCLSVELTTDELRVGSCTLFAGPNHRLQDSRCKLMIHALIYSEHELYNVFPVTKRYSYSRLYRIVTGEDCLAQFKYIRYTLDDLRSSHDGLRYYINMLEKREHHYLSWENDGDVCSLASHVAEIPSDIAGTKECCFYAVNKFLEDLRNYCYFSGYDVPEDRFRFAERFAGALDMNTSMFMWGMVRERENTVAMFSEDERKKTIQLLRYFEGRMKFIDEVFTKGYDR